MEKRLLDPLTALETSLTNLVQSLTNTNTFTAAPKTVRDLVTADEDLTDTLILLKKHQDNYQEILRLRAEKERLRNRLKETVYECVRLKKDLRDIDSRIVDESDTEDEENSANQNPVDYETLLAFASRIGKHNANAAQEAEKESDRRHEEARKLRQEDGPSSQPLLNGANGGDTATQPTVDRPTTSHSLRTEAVDKRDKLFREFTSLQRAQRTAPFPESAILRFGILGQLQLMHEESGEDAVRAHVETLIRESELKVSTQPVALSEPMEIVPKEVSVQPAGKDEPRRTAQAQRPQQAPPPRPAINLDLPDSDDDSDDD